MCLTFAVACVSADPVPTATHHCLVTCPFHLRFFPSLRSPLCEPVQQTSKTKLSTFVSTTNKPSSNCHSYGQTDLNPSKSSSRATAFSFLEQYTGYRALSPITSTQIFHLSSTIPKHYLTLRPCCFSFISSSTASSPTNINIPFLSHQFN